MKRIAQVSLIILSALFAACILDFLEEQKDKEEFDKIIELIIQNSFFPILTGSVWHYREVHEDNQSNEILSRFYTATIEGIETRNNKQYIKFAKTNDDESLFRGEGTMIYEFTHESPSDFPIYDSSLQPGEYNEFELPFVDEGDTVMVSGKLTYIGEVNLTTEIGTFEGCRVIELQGSVGGVPLGTVTRWYANNIGLVKQVEVDYQNGVLDHVRTSTLTYYNIIGGPSGGTVSTFSISGKVIEPGGGGVPDMEIILLSDSETISTVTTDNYGIFVFDDIFAGNYTVAIVDEQNNWWFSGNAIPLELEESNYTIPNITAIKKFDENVGRNIIGQARNAAGFPVPNAKITLNRMFGTWETQADPSGGFTFPGIPPGGDYFIKALRENWTFSPDSLSITVTSEQQNIQLVATSGPELTGRVITSTGTGIPGIKMVLTMDMRIESPAPEAQVEAITDDDGYYTFQAIGEGSYILKFVHDGYIVPIKPHMKDYGDNIYVTEPGGNITNIIASPIMGPHVITGTVQNSRNQGPSGLIFSLVNKNDQSELITYSAGGWFEFNALANGEYTLTLDPVTYTGTDLVRDIVINDADVFGLKFDITGFDLSGKARYNGQDIEGVSVKLHDPWMEIASTTTASDGSFTITDILNGLYDLRLEKEGSFVDFSVQVEIVNDNNDVGELNGNYTPAQ